MPREPRPLLAGAALLLLAAAGRATGDSPEREPGREATGKVYQWRSAAGLAYEYYLPRHYDPERGAGLTLILHPAGEERSWGFGNHEAGDFRGDDLVVAPDGTSALDEGGRRFLQRAEDLERLHGLVQDLRQLLHLRATFLYGYQDGATFALAYAGSFPSEVQGVVAQSARIGAELPLGPEGHGQAIALLHGTRDPNVPYARSEALLEAYRGAGYPNVHLRALEGWGQWPYPDQAEQALSWCEAVTSDDPERVTAVFDWIRSRMSVLDPFFVQRIASIACAMENVPESTRERAAELDEEVGRLAEEHVQAIAAALGQGSGYVDDGSGWSFELRNFLRDFAGLPACDALAEAWKARLAEQRADATRLWPQWYEARRKKKGEAAVAFSIGIDLVAQCFLLEATSDPRFLEELQSLRKQGELSSKKELQQAYDAMVPLYLRSLERGRKAYYGRDPRFGSPMGG